MVQKEIDDLATQQRQQTAAQQRTSNLQRAAAQQQEEILRKAARAEAERASRNSQARPVATTSVPQPAATRVPGYGDLGRADQTGSTSDAIWIGRVIIVAVTFGIACLLHWIIRPRRGMLTAVALGRKWSAWTIAIATICLWPSFFRSQVSTSLALWILVVPVSGVVAFLLGWIIGFFKNGQKHTQDSQET